jgi:transcriptional regulator with XRE-family HTH domain
MFCVLHTLFSQNACEIDKLRAYFYKHRVPVDPIYPHLGAAIKARRKTLGMKQKTLAGMLSISRGSLANIETGRQSVLVHQLYRFAEALELSPSDLLPPPTKTKSSTQDLPLPAGLKAQQKEQIARLFAQDD